MFQCLFFVNPLPNFLTLTRPLSGQKKTFLNIYLTFDLGNRLGIFWFCWKHQSCLSKLEEVIFTKNFGDNVCC